MYGAHHKIVRGVTSSATSPLRGVGRVGFHGSFSGFRVVDIGVSALFSGFQLFFQGFDMRVYFEIPDRSRFALQYLRMSAVISKGRLPTDV